MTQTADSINDLVDRFVQSFVHLDEMVAFKQHSLPKELFSYTETTYFEGRYRYETVYWKPSRLAVPRDDLKILRQYGALPRAFEHLVTHYAWLEIDLCVARLFDNPPGAGPDLYAKQMFQDPVLNNTLLPARYIRFALAPDSCYDPICFDLNRMTGDDCPIVQIEHESVLCYDKIGDIQTLYPSLRAMMWHVIKLADQQKRV